MTLRVGLLGTGGIGARHATALGKVPDLSLVACCGRDEGRTAEFAARFGIAPYTDFARMIEEANLDLLVVALPPFAHSGQVEAAAQAGVNLLVEKPIALDLGRAQAMVDAQEKERAEIGKELHDNINQILSTTKLYLELAKNDNNQRLNLINRSAGNIHNAIREIRNISRSLVPSSIGDLGLKESIMDLVESIRRTKTIYVEFYPMDELDTKISDKAKLMLFRIIQEQVNNVLKHSGARNLIIELILSEADHWIELSITDDGEGFHPEKVRKNGLGFSNITSRADLFGGKVNIQSAPGRGCKLRVQIPV